MLITKRGYQINKSILSDKQINNIKDELLLVPKLIPPFNIQEEPINLLHQTSSNIFIPRYYGVNKFGNTNVSFNSKSINIKFNGSLNEVQQSLIDKVMNHIKTKYGGVITLPCGYGKTVIALYIAAQLKLKTVILVHKETLKDQWIERIKQFLSDVSIGQVQGNTTQYDKDIIVGMIQTISSHNYTNEFNDIGLLIVDECHHIASKVFSKCLYKIGSKYTIGLSATPERKDGLTKIIHWYLGDQIIKINDKKCSQTVVYQIMYDCDNELFKVINKRFRGNTTIDTVKMTTNICNITTRNEMIKNIIIKLLENNKRNIMVLSGRIDHLNNLQQMVKSSISDDINISMYIGKCNKEERLEAENNARCIFASYSIASEGLDIPRLNTVILASPMKDVKQSVGRIMRKIHDNDANPLIIDIVDQIPPFINYSKTKLSLYNKSNYKIKDINVMNNINDYKIFNQLCISELLTN